jgi:hypothetical protein
MSTPRLDPAGFFARHRDCLVVGGLPADRVAWCTHAYLEKLFTKWQLLEAVALIDKNFQMTSASETAPGSGGTVYILQAEGDRKHVSAKFKQFLGLFGASGVWSLRWLRCDCPSGSGFCFFPFLAVHGHFLCADSRVFA